MHDLVLAVILCYYSYLKDSEFCIGSWTGFYSIPCPCNMIDGPHYAGSWHGKHPLQKVFPVSGKSYNWYLSRAGGCFGCDTRLLIIGTQTAFSLSRANVWVNLPDKQVFPLHSRSEETIARKLYCYTQSQMIFQYFVKDPGSKYHLHVSALVLLFVSNNMLLFTDLDVECLQWAEV